MNIINQFVLDAAPVLKAAFVKAFKVTAYIVLSAAIAAAYAFIAKTPFDPYLVTFLNVALAAAKKAIDELA
jgi:hypothetical protein